MGIYNALVIMHTFKRSAPSYNSLRPGTYWSNRTWGANCACCLSRSTCSLNGRVAFQLHSCATIPALSSCKAALVYLDVPYLRGSVQTHRAEPLLWDRRYLQKVTASRHDIEQCDALLAYVLIEVRVSQKYWGSVLVKVV